MNRKNSVFLAPDFRARLNIGFYECGNGHQLFKERRNGIIQLICLDPTCGDYGRWFDEPSVNLTVADVATPEEIAAITERTRAEKEEIDRHFKEQLRALRSVYPKGLT